MSSVSVYVGHAFAAVNAPGALNNPIFANVLNEQHSDCSRSAIVCCSVSRNY